MTVATVETLEQDPGDHAKSILDNKVLKTFTEKCEEITNILVNIYYAILHLPHLHLPSPPSATHIILLFMCLPPRMFYMNKALFLFTKSQHQCSLKQNLVHNRH